MSERRIFLLRSLLTAGVAVGVFFLTLSAARLLGQQGTDAAGSRFEAWDVWVDAADQTLAAYQFEFLDGSGRSTVVGVEGGEHAAFRDAPHYDSKALSKGRLIVAAFSTGEDLPRGKTRVARLHLQIHGEGAPPFDVKIMASASFRGRKIPATVTLKKVILEKGK